MVAYLRHAVIPYISSFAMRGLRLRRMDAGLLFVFVVVYAGVAAPPHGCGIVVRVRYLWVIFPNISHNNLVGRPITL